MEINPIAAIRPLQPIRNQRPVIGLQAVFDIESYAHLAQEADAHKRHGSPSGLTEEWDDYNASSEEVDFLPPVEYAEPEPGHRLNFIV